MAKAKTFDELDFSTPPDCRLSLIGPGVRHLYGKYLCVCGAVKEIKVYSVRTGTTKSCGCKKKDHAVVIGRRNRTHGSYGTRTYRIWQGMLARCYSGGGVDRYGRRGISVCDRWQGENGFANFLADVGDCPSGVHCLDRHPNNNGNYEPGNVRWATYRQNNRNRSDNILVGFRGEVKCVSEWADQVGVTAGALAYRIERWGILRAMTTPKITSRRKLEVCRG